MKHHQLTGHSAIHPFAFVQDTDPALDPDNHVTAYKAWIDTSSGNALKIRNATNTAWDTIFAGATQAVARFERVDYIQRIVDELPGDEFGFFPNPWYQLEYI